MFRVGRSVLGVLLSFKNHIIHIDLHRLSNEVFKHLVTIRWFVFPAFLSPNDMNF